MIRITLALLLQVHPAAGQYGTAPNGFYPMRYSGSTFTGRLLASDGRTNSITISSDNEKRAEQFTGRLEQACAVPSKTGKLMMASDIPEGTDLTAFFVTETIKVDKKKEKKNVIIAISFNTWDGKPVPALLKKTYWCTADQYHYFKPFAGHD